MIKANPKNIYQPPLKVNCFKCSASLVVNYLFPLKGYPRKNNWEFWTKKEEDLDKYICSDCLKDMYYNHKEEYFTEINNSQRRKLLRTYVSTKII